MFIIKRIFILLFSHDSKTETITKLESNELPLMLQIYLSNFFD